MSSIASISGSVLGGLGLFLLGMWLLTEGLKMAAGPALQTLLGTWTRTSLRGFLSGATMTALMQSSSGATVAIIGFVNAGLLTMSYALWVVFGSNVGTTMTGWLVAVIGFHFKIDAFALPIIGLGAFLQLFSPRQRYRAFGRALAGFGILFLGIDTLKDTFMALGQSFDITTYFAPGAWGLISMVFAGIVLTTLMQSSSAAIALVLTAVGGGLMPLAPGAAMVIGANIGTTSTAIFSVIGATSNARRVAAAHVVFNVLTGIVALLLLPVLIKLIEVLNLSELNIASMGEPTVSLALFHTIFNLLGVLLMIPLVKHLVKFLNNQFRTAEEDLSRPRYLDKASKTVPDLAINSLTMEFSRLSGLVTDVIKDAINAEEETSRALNRNINIVENLIVSITEYISKMSRNPLTDELSESNVLFLRTIEYYRGIIRLMHFITTLQVQILETGDQKMDEKLNNWLAKIIELSELTDLSDPEKELDPEELNRLLEKIKEDEYDPLKQRILAASARGRINMKEMEMRLELISQLRRVARQLAKAARIINKFKQQRVLHKHEKEEVTDQEEVV